MEYTREYCFLSRKNPSIVKTIRLSIKWEKPPTEWLKANIDGARSSNRLCHMRLKRKMEHGFPYENTCKLTS